MFAVIKSVTKKYFIAIVLEEEILERAEALKQELFNRYGLKGALRSPAHITLHRPFEWKEEKENELIAGLEKFKFDSSFTLVFNNFNCFEPRVIYIDLEQNQNLFDLHKKLEMHCRINFRLLNETEDKRGFHPHVTIAFRDLKKPMFYELWQRFSKEKFAGSMLVANISLLKLGSKWEVLRDFNI